MAAKLIVIAGSSEGMIFPLTEAEVSVGREPDNLICLPDMSVSRRHCSVKRNDGTFTIFDLDSRNSTAVNGMPIKQQVLKTGDRIRVGDTLFLFLLDETADSGQFIQVNFNEARIVANHTMQLRKDTVVDFNTAEQDVVAPSRSTRDLNALLKISLAVNSIQNLESYAQQLLPLVFEVIPASRGAILVADESSDQFASVFGRHRAANCLDPIEISRTVTERAMREAEAFFSNDVLQDVAFRGAKSLAAAPIQALMVVPLAVDGKVSGAIYLDTSDQSVSFDEDHLQLMRAIASVAAVALSNIQRVSNLENENLRLKAEIAVQHDMVGNSPRMRDVYQFIGKAAPTNSTVLIRGESGTGKELAARAIHFNSQRSAKPFVAINCAALTETLLESELFGHEKGAFTGAVATKKGKLEVAEGGTVFLDEIGEMAMSLQAKLLRVLQGHEFERVGGTRTIKADIRLIAATNRNLEQAIKDGIFREDLYYRLNVLRLTMPALRERREDILPLAMFFAAKYSQQCNRQVRDISPQARNCLINYDWPGNVRELENAIERAVVMGIADTLQIEDLPEDLISTIPISIASPGQTNLNFYEAVNQAKKQLILSAFDQAQGNYTEAARLLEMHPNHLHRLIRNLGMKSDLKK
ncbi:MAG: sigma 54-interacting transcriptional regulator [Acidobacteriota bacterium]|nr:sigma 54-interacting transcriptional regulator [Acidobacteriota bacterium]